MIFREKKNFLTKYYAQLLEHSEFLVFFHVTSEFHDALNGLFFQNQIKHIMLVNSFSRKFFANKPTLQLFLQGPTAVLAFANFANLEVFFTSFAANIALENTQFLPLGVYWIERNRILSVNYLITAFNANRLANVNYFPNNSTRCAALLNLIFSGFSEMQVYMHMPILVLLQLLLSIESK